MAQVTGKDYGLAPAPGCAVAPVRNLSLVPTDPKPCDGTMTCDCKACSAERAARVARGTHRARQPWEPKAA